MQCNVAPTSHFDADLDPAFHFDADPVPALNTMRIRTRNPDSNATTLDTACPNIMGLNVKTACFDKLPKFLVTSRCCTANGNMTDHDPDTSNKGPDPKSMRYARKFG